MTSEQKYEGKGDYANPTSTNGSNPEQTANSAPTEPSIKASLSLTLTPSLYSVTPGASSQSTLVLYALMAARETYMEEMLQGLSEGSYRATYAGYRDMGQVNELIDELAMDAINQAECNYWANEDKGRPSTWAEKLKYTKEQNERAFAKWLKVLTDRTPEEVE